MLTYCGSVQSWECDHIGHLNITGCMARFNEATWVLFASIGLTRGYMARECRGMSAVKHEIDYSSELLPGDTCYIESEISDIGTTSLKGRHVLRNDASKQSARAAGLRPSISTEPIAHRCHCQPKFGIRFCAPTSVSDWRLTETARK